MNKTLSPEFELQTFDSTKGVIKNNGEIVANIFKNHEHGSWQVYSCAEDIQSDIMAFIDALESAPSLENDTILD